MIQSVHDHKNLDINNGLVNGSVGKLISIKLENDIPTQLYFKFEDPSIGSAAKRITSPHYNHALTTTNEVDSVPIKRHEVTLKIIIKTI